MKHICWIMIFLVAGICTAGEWAPLIDFTALAGEKDVIRDTSGEAVMKLGPAVKRVSGPYGLSALEFNGSNKGSATLDLGKWAERFDGFDFSVDFWVRYRYQSYVERQANPDLAGSGNRTGLGLEVAWDGGFQYQWPACGPWNVSFRSATALDFDAWHQITFTFSHAKGESRLYLDGRLHQSSNTKAPYPLLLDSLKRPGCFIGALAGIRLWDKALPAEQVGKIPITGEGLKDLYDRLAAVKPLRPAFAGCCDALKKELDAIAAAGSAYAYELDDLDRRITRAGQLQQAEAAFTNTSLADAPYALQSVKACSGIIRVPDGYSKDARYLTTLSMAAARGEFEPVSFIVQPYRSIEKFEVIPGDFKSSDGATIPASALDRKVVKCWYQASWDSYFNNVNQTLLPDLLLNDENLVQVNEVTRKNYLRFNYSNGAKYEDVNFTGNPLEVNEFNFLTAPIADSPEFLPVKLTPGRGTQFWFTVHVPKDAKPGHYVSRVKTLADGKPAGEFDLALRVYPFELPPAMTATDLERPYITYTIGASRLSIYCQLTSDQAEAERILAMDIDNQRDHNIIHQGPDVPLGLPIFSDELAYRDIQMRVERGVPLKPFFAGVNADWGLWQGMRKAVWTELITPERRQESTEKFLKALDTSIPRLEKILGHKDYFYCGFDECQSDSGLLFQSYYRRFLHERGMKIQTTGWEENYIKDPFSETLHFQCTGIDPVMADRWHAIGGQIASYATPFAGPDNPELLRRSHGLQLYCANWDGYLMLSYCGGTHLWNERINGMYRNFQLAYPTPSGPINSISMEGLREGLDDVRYATLLRMLIRDAYDSKRPEAMDAARRAALFLSGLTAKDTDLDLCRMTLSGHILRLMRLLGRVS